MTALPLTLPHLSRGFAALPPLLRFDGAAFLRAIADALSDALGVGVAIEATAAPAVPAAVLGAARLGLVFPVLGELGFLEVDTGLLAAVLRQLSGRGGRPWPAVTASDPQTTLLAFCALIATDAARSCGLDTPVPLVSVDTCSASIPPGSLAVHLALRVGDHHGWGRALLSPNTVAALGEAAPPSDRAGGIVVHGSLRDATITLLPDELAAMAAGDVLLLDPPSAHADLVLPGGLTFRGRLERGLHVQEIRMTEPQSSYPLVLSVEISRVRVTLGDLARLAPGAVLPLDVRKDGAVVLRAGEDAIARGTLVDVEGTLGVRLAQIGPLP